MLSIASYQWVGGGKEEQALNVSLNSEGLVSKGGEFGVHPKQDGAREFAREKDSVTPKVLHLGLSGSQGERGMCPFPNRSVQKPPNRLSSQRNAP